MVALSSTEEEYRGAAMVACEVTWLELLLGDLGIQVQRSVVIHCINLSSIQLAQNPVFHARTKHIEVHYHFIRERVFDGSIDLTFVRTDEQVANIFTKALGAKKLRQFRAMLGVRELALSLIGSVEISSSTHGPPGSFSINIHHWNMVADTRIFASDTVAVLHRQVYLPRVMAYLFCQLTH
ncbi:hypothetical protein L7F22_045818 [Adiantum nelumboides]|nr:hypothetical protein [Adiantum nelumboides]